MSQELYLAETNSVSHDDAVDKGIQDCLHIGSGKSFITFAGAGSGKTYSLKEALVYLKKIHYQDFLRHGKQIAVVTFTNNAAEEVKERVEKSSIFSVSTIHSFCWNAISGFNEDIRKWYLETIPSELAKVEDEERRGRASKASDARKRSIIRLNEKMEWLSEPRSFIYDPNGVASSKNSLSHADVLKIFSNFVLTKPMMAEILVNKYPFIFIDESQDTNKDVINAFFALRDANLDKVVIGIFGDTMQRIFGGGEPELGKAKPNDWIIFEKRMNHRSARRIVGLANQIRSEDDGRHQYAIDGSSEGYVRYFLLPAGTENKDEIEASIRERMAKVTGDVEWTNAQSKESAILLLEHKMAGRRLGFYTLWEMLARSEKIKDQISEGKNAELNFLARIVFPLAEASLRGRRAELISILRENQSPLLDPSLLEANKEDPLAIARAAEHSFRHVVSDDAVSFRSVLENIAEQKLLNIPAKLLSFVQIDGSHNQQSPVGQINDALESGERPEYRDESEFSAWADALETRFFQAKNYKDYIDEKSIFRTHQGVKGNEFERVMVIMDDDEAGGFLFSYEQYFGARELSASSQKKQNTGEETGLDRTRRLFYVTSTRAKSSLAHVIYTSDIKKVRESLVKRRFAREDEVIELLM